MRAEGEEDKGEDEALHCWLVGGWETDALPLLKPFIVLIYK